MAPHDRGVVAHDHVAGEGGGGAGVPLDRHGVLAERDDEGAGRGLGYEYRRYEGGGEQTSGDAHTRSEADG